MKRKLIVFHPALAPYRIDFFNALADRFTLHLVLLGRNLQEQAFDQKKLLPRLRCRVSYFLSGFVILGRYIRTGAILLVRREHPEVVLTYEYSLITLSLVLYRRIARASFKLYTMTDDNLELFRKCRGLRAAVRRAVLRHIDGAIVIDEAVKSAMREIAGRDTLDVVTVPILYDESVFRKDEKKIFNQAASWRSKNLKEGEKAIVFVGRLVAVKNLHWLVDVAISPIWPVSCRLFIVGEGSLVSDLREKAFTAGDARRVTFMGRKEGDALQIYFAAADALVLCSVSETFGAVVSEALHWGARVYVSNHVGAKVLIRPGVNGGVFSLDGGEEFCSYLRELAQSGPAWREGRPSLVPIRLADAVSNFKP